MCGIVGVISTKVLDRKKKDLFATLLQFDVVRGKDSTGAFFVDEYQDRPANFTKSTCLPTDFVQTNGFSKASEGALAAVGHNRAATLGKVNSLNAHPFQHGSVTLVHNGTLRHPYPASYTRFDVDSEAIAYELSIVQPSRAKDVLESLQGAFALVWHDARDGKIRIARNSERPLHYCQTVDKTNLVLSSEAGIMLAAFMHEELTAVKMEHIHSIPVGEIWELDISGKEITREVVTFTPKPQYQISSYTTGSSSSYKGTAGTTTNANGYSNALGYSPAGAKNLKETFGIDAGWYPAYVLSYKPYSTNTGKGALHVMLDGFNGQEVVIYNTTEPKTNDMIEVFVTEYWPNAHGNQNNPKPKDKVFNGNGWRYQERPKLALVHSGEPEEVSATAGTDDQDDSSGILVHCTNCGNYHPHDSCAELNDSSFVCADCYGNDPQVQMYCHSVGIKRDFIEV